MRGKVQLRRRGRAARERRRRALATIAAGSTALLAVQLAVRPSAAQPPVPPGTAAADASLMGVVPQASSLSLTTSAGHSEAAYNQTEDQAASGTVDLGGLGVLLANTPVCGQVFFTEQRQPHPLTADSQDGSRTESGSGGRESVTVSSSPEQAQATTAPVSQSIPGVLQVSGRSIALVRYTEGTEQSATATVTADLTLLGGVVKMEGAAWKASLEQGLKDASSASFSPGTVILAPAGLPIRLPSTDSVAAVFAAVNKVLEVFGVSVSPPVRTVDATTGSLSMSPLDVHFTGSPTDNTVLRPVAAGVPALEQILAAQTGNGSDCAQLKNLLGNLLAPTETVFNVGLSAAQGAGGLDVDLGGATVSVQPAPDYANPFSAGFAAPATLSSPSAQPGQVPAGSPSSPAVAGPTSPPAPEVAPGPGSNYSTGNNSGSPAATPAALVRCVTTSPAGSPGCWKGLGVIAGAAVVTAGVVLLVADLTGAAWPARLSPRRRARRRRFVP